MSNQNVFSLTFCLVSTTPEGKTVFQDEMVIDYDNDKLEAQYTSYCKFYSVCLFCMLAKKEDNIFCKYFYLEH